MSKIELLRDVLQNAIDNIDCGNSYANEDQCDQLIEVVNKVVNTKNKLSKYQACKYLNISRATFDNKVREGKIPRGRKEQGFKELFWFKEDLDNINLEK